MDFMIDSKSYSHSPIIYSARVSKHAIKTENGLALTKLQKLAREVRIATVIIGSTRLYT